MQKIIFMMLASVLVLAACGGNGSSSSANENATLAPVPAEYAGLTNPLGADAASEGRRGFQNATAKCAMDLRGMVMDRPDNRLTPSLRNLAELQPKAGDDFLFWRIQRGQTRDFHGGVERNSDGGADLAGSFFYSHIKVV